MEHLLNIDDSQTSERFKHLRNEILNQLLEKLNLLDKLELEMHIKTSPNLTGVDIMDLWKDYDNRCQQIIESISLNHVKSNMRSYGEPPKYVYFNKQSTKVFFVMKSENKAIIETEYELGLGLKRKEQFTLKKDLNIWKIETKKCSFTKQNKWMVDEV